MIDRSRFTLLHAGQLLISLASCSARFGATWRAKGQIPWSHPVIIEVPLGPAASMRTSPMPAAEAVAALATCAQPWPRRWCRPAIFDILGVLKLGLGFHLTAVLLLSCGLTLLCALLSIETMLMQTAWTLEPWPLPCASQRLQDVPSKRLIRRDSTHRKEWTGRCASAQLTDVRLVKQTEPARWSRCADASGRHPQRPPAKLPDTL